MYRDRYGNPLIPASEVRRLQVALEQLAAQREALHQQNEQLQRTLFSARRQLETRTQENQHLVEALRAREQQVDPVRVRHDAALRAAEQARQQAEEARAERDRALAEVHQLRAELEEARKEAPATAQLQRLAADLANVRRNRDAQIAQGVEREKVRLLGELVGLHDGLRRAIDASDQPESALHQGLEALRQQVLDALKRDGAELVGQVGEVFDPTRHEALAAMPHDGPAGVVLTVHEQGLALGERLVRPARVVVSAES